MSDRTDDRAKREAAEAKLVFSRIKELYEHPIRGPFDLDHLHAVHAHIFQDLPQHRPGEVRGDTSGWSKNRVLEGSNAVHEVHYAHEGIADRIRTTLRDLGGPDGLKDLGPDAFASRMATLYGDLDQSHGFYEGFAHPARVHALAGARQRLRARLDADQRHRGRAEPALPLLCQVGCPCSA